MTTFVCVITISFVTVIYSLAFWFEYYRYNKKIDVLEKNLIKETATTIKTQLEVIKLVGSNIKLLDNNFRLLALMTSIQSAKSIEEVKNIVAEYYEERLNNDAN